MRDRSIPGGSEFTGDRRSDDVYERLRVLEERLNRNPWTRGVLLDTEDSETAVPHGGLAFTAGTARTLRHNLGRRARGFIEVYLPNVPSAGHCRLRSTAMPTGMTADDFITVTASTTGTCAILVF